jgi:type IV secretory pathway VirB2 component (pilin)
MKLFLMNLAVTLVGGGEVDNVPTLSSGEVLQNGLNIVYGLAGIVAVITIIIGGILYTTSAGDSGNITKAKNLITYAVVGLVIVFAAFAITNFVILRFN